MQTNDLSLLSSQTRALLDLPGSLWIAGEQLATSRSLPVIDPSSGGTVGSIADGDAAHVDAAVVAARAAFDQGPWPRLPGAEREARLRRLADLMERDARVLAELETVDVGMPIWMARDLNVGGSIAVVRYMAGLAGRTAGRTVPVHTPEPGASYFGYTQREPLGVIGAIIPWNVPLMLAVWKLAPALAAGCTIVLKPSEEASCSVLHLARLAAEAGVPAGVVNVVTGRGHTAGAALASHPGIDKITFTGSTATGKQIARAAAENVTQVALELGGKSPQLLFADADLDRAIAGIANSVFLNSGQVCVAGSRVYIERGIYDEAVNRLASHVKDLRVGSGLDAATQLGPLISERQQRRVLGMIDQAVSSGAEVLTGNYTVDAPGFYVRPVVAAVADQKAAIVREEVFGPVVAVAPFSDLEEAIALANDSDYGLAAMLWTSSIKTMHTVVPRLQSGRVAINSEPMPYPALPEGGRKASGYGRDLSEQSFESYLDTKSVLLRY
jgi:phenylacetaldehyde dehydrogenase